MLTAWYRFLWNTVTIKRSTTVQSDTGVSKLVYSVLATNVPCNIQNSGGRLSQEEFGTKRGSKYKLTFPPDQGFTVEVNDLVIFADGQTLRVTRDYQASYYGEGNNHTSCDAEPYVPAGD